MLTTVTSHNMKVWYGIASKLEGARWKNSVVANCSDQIKGRIELTKPLTRIRNFSLKSSALLENCRVTCSL